MKGMRRVVAWMLASLTLAGGRAHAQLTPADSATFVRVTQSLLDAITYGDSSVWAPHLAPSWFIIDEEGNRLSRADFLPALRGLPPGQSGVLRVGAWHLVGEGDVAVMSYDIEEEHDYYGQHLRTRFHATDTWIRRGGGWRMLASQVTALPTRVTGRSLPRDVLDAYAGTYALTDEITLDIVAADDGLRLVRGSAPPDPLRALTDGIFVRDGRRGFYVFERDEGGAVVRLVHWRDNNPVAWRRR